MTDSRMVSRSYGPFDVERQAQHAAARLRGEHNTPERAAYITAALESAHMGFGDYDRHIARLLAGESSTVVGTIIDWVHRAFEAGVTSGARVFELTARLNVVPTDEQVDALYEAGLSDCSVDYGSTEADLYVSRVAYSRSEAAGTIRQQVATVEGLEVLAVVDTDEETQP